MIVGWALWALGCADYTVVFAQRSDPPLPVTVSPRVEIPEGLVVLVSVRAYKNGEELELDGSLELEVDDPSVIGIFPVEVGDTGAEEQFALAAVSAGSSAIVPWVRGHEAEWIPVEITEQPEPE